MNVFTLISIIESLGCKKIAAFIDKSAWIGLLLMGLIMLLNFMVFFRNQKYITIKAQFENKSKKYRNCTIAIWLAYIFLSCFFLIYFL